MSPTQQDQRDQKEKQSGEPAEVKVTVTFPLAAKPPYKADVDATQTAEPLRAAAMSYFGVSDEPTATYYLTHKGDRVPGTQTVGSLADEARAVKFTLAKELIQG
jgi:hypothetical protein